MEKIVSSAHHSPDRWVRNCLISRPPPSSTNTSMFSVLCVMSSYYSAGGVIESLKLYLFVISYHVSVTGACVLLFLWELFYLLILKRESYLVCSDTIRRNKILFLEKRKREFKWLIHTLATPRFSSRWLFVPQGERSDGRSGGEPSAAADGDNSCDAGRPTGGGDGFREESPNRLGRWEHTHSSLLRGSVVR